MGTFATAVSCIDGRIQLPVIEHIKSKYKVDYVDMITLPGPNKVLAEGKDESAIASIKNCVKISVELHGSRLIAVTGHCDCAGNPADKKIQVKQIIAAAGLIISDYPDADVIGLWVDENRKVEEISSVGCVEPKASPLKANLCEKRNNYTNVEK